MDLADFTPVEFCPTPPQAAKSRLAAFTSYCEVAVGRRFADWPAFEHFAIKEFRDFWELLLTWSEFPLGGSLQPICSEDNCERAQFFPHVQLNYTEVLLNSRPPPCAAIVACHKDRPPDRVSFGELRRRIEQLAVRLQTAHVQPGDRIVAIARNNLEVVTAALAAAAIGAVFSSCSHDMGSFAVLSRFHPLQPKVLFANLRSEPWDSFPLAERVHDVVRGLPTLTTIVSLDDDRLDDPRCVTLSQWLQTEAAFVWQRFPFNHPLFILFSSGTTGAPKCIVHGAGGTLLEHFKEHVLHCDLKAGDRLFFQTSCGWMMWNWQLSALAAGTELVVYDGPLDAPESLWNIVDQQRVTVFGTNPAYLQFCQDSGFKPCEASQFPALRAMLSTGSILYPRQFDWVRESVKRLPLQSISGGTDIIGCFVLGNPNLPVYRGEVQCRSLGMDVRSLAPDEAGIGELVCANPFPSRPLGFLDDPDRERFHNAYFSQHDGVWTHGDLIEFTARGGAVLHGRSDGVINIRGIRIGPAEIYRILQDHPAIIEAMAVEQQAMDEPGGARLVLLVVLRQELDGPLVASIRRMLATRGSFAMVPARILQVDALPVTHSGKRSEAAARDAVNLRAARNRDALRNPDCLEQIAAQMASSFEPELRLESSQTLEADLLRACQDWLGVPISPMDNLLSLGVDSLSMLGLLMRVEQRFGCDIPLGSFEPTVHGIAAAVSGRTDSAAAFVRIAGPDDASDVCALLHEGFPNIKQSNWHHLFAYSWGQTPPDRGYVLVAGRQIVGFLGTVYAEREINGKQGVVCNLTSWYIRPAWRGWGGAMLNQALQDHTKTYTVFTPSNVPRQMFEMLDFTSFGNTVALPPLVQPGSQRRLLIIHEPDQIRAYLNCEHRRIFDDHAGYDCLALVAAEPDGYAFIVTKRRYSTPHRLVPSVPTSRMIYCSNPAVLMRHAEHIKLAIMRKQRTFAVLVSDSWMTERLRGIRAKGRSLFRSKVFSSSDLDMLYSEIVLLPI